MNVEMGRQGRGIGRKDKDECEDGRNREEEQEGKTEMNVKTGKQQEEQEGKTKINVKMGETGKRNRKERQR